jgi:hypothetical protein
MNPDAGYPQLLWGAADGTHGGYMDGMPGAIELPMKAGDALILNELCTHGSTVRTIPGHRRMCLLRYSPKETLASAHAPLGWEAPPVRDNPVYLEPQLLNDRAQTRDSAHGCLMLGALGAGDFRAVDPGGEIDHCSDTKFAGRRRRGDEASSKAVEAASVGVNTNSLCSVFCTTRGTERTAKQLS